MRQQPKHPVLYEDLDGVEIPYRPIDMIHEVQDDGTVVVQPILPPDIQNVRHYKGNGNLQTLITAMYQVRREILGDIAREIGTTIHGWEAMLAVSAEQSFGTYSVDGERIIMNEDEAEAIARDSDGDRALQVVTGNECDLVNKFPTTTEPVMLRETRPPKESFSDFDMDIVSHMLEGTDINYDLEAQFEKGHKPNVTGLRTSQVNNWELYETRGPNPVPLWDALESMYRHRGRIAYIEGDLKFASKDDSSIGNMAGIPDYPSLGKRLTSDLRWGLTAVGSISDINNDDLNWMDSDTLEPTIKKILKLDLEFEPVVPPGPTKVTERPIFEFYLLDRLLASGVVKYKDIPHMNPNLPPAILLWLEWQGEPVALMSSKHGGGLNYCYLIPPVFDPQARVRDEEGKVDVTGRTEPRWCHPLEHLAKELEAFDSRIINPNGGQTGWYCLPRQRQTVWDHLSKYEVKTRNMLRLISDWASEVGDDRLPTQNLAPSQIALYYIRNMAYIDYRQTETIEQKRAIVHLAEATGINIAIGSCKEADGKFLLAHPNGVPITADETDHPRRSGQIKSQVIRAIRHNTFKVAIVMPRLVDGGIVGTKTQCHITPSGIDKQKADVYLPLVSNTPKEGYIPRDYRMLTGKKYRCWVGSARATAEIGKLVDHHGMKFVPRRFHEQVVTASSGDNIDLLIPITEIVAKGCHVAFLLHAQEEDIIVDGQRVRALVGDYKFARTGTASENVPARYRQATYCGLDGMRLRHELAKSKMFWPDDLWFDEMVENGDLDLTFHKLRLTRYAEAMANQVTKLGIV